MIFEQFYLGCLAHASYLIGSDGEAAVVDPQRDVDQYIEAAERNGLSIRWVIETHLHADFVSGHRELAARTGAEIVFGAAASAEFPHRGVRDGDELTLGRVVLRALETPGHTPESVSWLVIDRAESDEPQKVLTGDTLFIGDVGRPDLVGSKGFTSAQMAGMLYDSLHRKILVLPDSVEVYPAHGAGSACGRNISRERFSTIGEQRRMNYALRPMSREEFIGIMTTDLPEPPQYFPMDAEINRRGARPLSEISADPLPPSEVNRRLQLGATILDVRRCEEFGNGHVPGSVNISLNGQFASWAGTLLSPQDSIVIVGAGEEEVGQAVMRLARVGMENIAGYLAGGIIAWSEAGLELATLPQISVDELRLRQEENAGLRVFDVRGPGEYGASHVPGAVNLPLGQLRSRLAEIPREGPLAVICASGYRSSSAASLLQKEGYHDLTNVIGGTSAWVGAGYEVQR